MPDLEIGQIHFMQGSGKKPYELKNVGGSYSCNCPAWRNQSAPVNLRTCKHLRKLRGDAAEEARIGATSPLPPVPATRDVPPLLLATNWTDEDPTNWHWSEKLDGVRAYWTGEKFLSRLGNVFHTPAWFANGLPTQPLDGELWLGRGQFQATMSIVRSFDAGEAWRPIKFIVFDAPSHQGPFEARLASLNALLDTAGYASPHPHTMLDGKKHLQAELARIERLGGEGLMIRQPKSLYEVGRSSTLLKVVSFDSSEAVVTGYQPGKGKYKGKVGALLCKWGKKAIELGTGLTDADRRSPPKVGAIVKFRYKKLTDGGLPRHPAYVGLDDD